MKNSSPLILFFLLAYSACSGESPSRVVEGPPDTSDSSVIDSITETQADSADATHDGVSSDSSFSDSSIPDSKPDGSIDSSVDSGLPTLPTLSSYATQEIADTTCLLQQSSKVVSTASENLTIDHVFMAGDRIAYQSKNTLRLFTTNRDGLSPSGRMGQVFQATFRGADILALTYDSAANQYILGRITNFIQETEFSVPAISTGILTASLAASSSHALVTWQSLNKLFAKRISLTDKSESSFQFELQGNLSSSPGTYSLTSVANGSVFTVYSVHWVQGNQYVLSAHTVSGTGSVTSKSMFTHATPFTVIAARVQGDKTMLLLSEDKSTKAAILVSVDVSHQVVPPVKRLLGTTSALSLDATTTHLAVGAIRTSQQAAVRLLSENSGSDWRCLNEVKSNGISFPVAVTADGNAFLATGKQVGGATLLYAMTP